MAITNPYAYARSDTTGVFRSSILGIGNLPSWSTALGTADIIVAVVQSTGGVVKSTTPDWSGWVPIMAGTATKTGLSNTDPWIEVFWARGVEAGTATDWSVRYSAPTRLSAVVGAFRGVDTANPIATAVMSPSTATTGTVFSFAEYEEALGDAAVHAVAAILPSTRSATSLSLAAKGSWVAAEDDVYFTASTASYQTGCALLWDSSLAAATVTGTVSNAWLLESQAGRWQLEPSTDLWALEGTA